MVEITDVRKSYGNKHAVNGISFEVKEGEILGFLGPNGAGKSTTLNIITGYLSADSGSVKIDGTDILEEPLKAKKDIGFLKWYYRLLSDPEGLDLFGNTTPDIAFLQPVIVDLARKMLRENISDDMTPEEKDAARKRNAQLDKLRFADLMERIYFGKEGDPQSEIEIHRQEIIDYISDFCSIEGFGKPKRA